MQCRWMNIKLLFSVSYRNINHNTKNCNYYNNVIAVFLILNIQHKPMKDIEQLYKTVEKHIKLHKSNISKNIHF